MEEEIEIDPKDIKIELLQVSRSAWSHAPDTCRITHLPTGIIGTGDGERSIHKNRATAMLNLKTKLKEHYKMSTSEDVLTRLIEYINQPFPDTYPSKAVLQRVTKILDPVIKAEQKPAFQLQFGDPIFMRNHGTCWDRGIYIANVGASADQEFAVTSEDGCTAAYDFIKPDLGRTLLRWIDWEGGQRPINGKVRIIVKLSECVERMGLAEDFDWEANLSNRITAYCLWHGGGV